MTTTHFGIIGGGWRAEFFIRVAQALPDQFEVSSVMVRDQTKAQAFADRLKVTTCQTLDQLLADTSIHFVVLSVPRAAHPSLLSELGQRNVPVLCETPPGEDEMAMAKICDLERHGLRIQIAEQLHLRPMHAARIDLARSGLLGNVQQAQVSVAHGYHGISLIRRLLGVSFEPVTITARPMTSTIIAGPGRQGPPAEEKTVNAFQELAWLDFGDRLGVYDFSSSQYFSSIRNSRMLVQGERGEISNYDVRYLKDFRTPIHLMLRRCAAGENDNLEGCYFKGIQAGDQWVYTNPFIPARLSDDEIAVAACLQKMNEFVQGGPAFYSLAEACQDNYLARLMTQAATTGVPQTSQPQTWTS